MSGATSQCSVCTDPRRDEIDASLRAGWTHLRVAQTYLGSGSRRHAVNRHVKNSHVPEGPSGTPDATRKMDENASAVTILRETLNDLRRIDVRKLPAGQRIQHHDAVRRAAEALSKVEPPETRMTATVDDVEGLPELFAAWYEALEVVPCPGCGRANGPHVRELMAKATREVAPILLERAGVDKPIPTDDDSRPTDEEAA